LRQARSGLAEAVRMRLSLIPPIFIALWLLGPAFANARDVNPPTVELDINDRHFRIPRDYIRTLSKNPPGVNLFASWPTFEAFRDEDAIRRVNPGSWNGVMIVMLDDALSRIPIALSYERLSTLLGTSVRMEDHYGLSWEGPGPDSNPYDPHEIGTAWTKDGKLASFVICGRTCELQIETLAGLTTVTFPKTQLEHWETIGSSLRSLIQRWER